MLFFIKKVLLMLLFLATGLSSSYAMESNPEDGTPSLPTTTAAETVRFNCDKCSFQANHMGNFKTPYCIHMGEKPYPLPVMTPVELAAYEPRWWGKGDPFSNTADIVVQLQAVPLTAAQALGLLFDTDDSVILDDIEKMEG